jgi:hypothetical protein
MLWACQPVVAAISDRVAPPDRRIISNIFARLLIFRAAWASPGRIGGRYFPSRHWSALAQWVSSVREPTTIREDGFVDVGRGWIDPPESEVTGSR